jgi:hypothetical protein
VRLQATASFLLQQLRQVFSTLKENTMAGTDSGGVNDRLNGLVTLLQSVGIDGVDSDVLLEQQKRQTNSKTKGNNKSMPKKKTSSTHDSTSANISNDAQILEIVKKLQQAQADSPEILEALKSPELLALASLAAQKQGLQARAPEPSKPVATSLDDVIDVDDDNYPKIGPGYSDDISVVSELSTPTVMTRQHVADEEYYSELKAGGQGVVSSIGGGLASGRLARTSRTTPNRPGLGVGKLGAGKTKNMVGQVRPLAARRAIPPIPAIPVKAGGGAAAQRRLNYQMAMSKLESDGFGNTTQDTAQPISPVTSINSNLKDKKLAKAPTRTVSGTRSIGSGSGGGGSKRKPRSINAKIKSNGDDIDWGMADGDGWPTFDDPKNNSSSNELFVDSDGFFSDNVFSSNDGSVGAAPSITKSRRRRTDKSISLRSADGSTSSGSKKKMHREDRGGSSRKSHRLKKEKDSERSFSDDDREGSTRKSHRLKKEKDKDNLSDDGLGTSRKSHKVKKDKDKDKSGRRKTRRASMM